MKKRVVFGIFAVMLIGVGVLVYYGQHRERGKEIYYSGTIETTNANLAFQVGGKVVNVALSEGQPVKAGQLLAELDASEFRSRASQAEAGLTRATAARDLAKAAYAEAQRNLNRSEELYRRKVVSTQERDAVKLAFDNARSTLQQAEALLDQAVAARDQTVLQLEYPRLTAPFDGLIISRAIEPGEVVNAGREVMTVADLARVELKIYVDETAIGGVKPGQQVEVRVDAFPRKAFDGVVAYISPEAEFTPKIIQTRKERVKLVYMVKVELANPSLELKAGMPADAYLR